ncbi:peptide chain release factor 3 [Subtercola vilae]|uniref:Peptide chain release factor 3 n=1 Tax=Subtercola vilae TaxID=2056433 RepID=A0A4T2BF93_9MICO|nr:peptide chain release factor 3 [Subtercola vilae]TIH29490.1 peptide chain release factor 3 [Subtercola vilae]
MTEADNLLVLDQAMRRRTIAVISHPDAGKSTLTEAMLLHAHRISEAGAVNGKPGRRGTVSDWMAMEQERGISISSAVVQFEHRGTIINVVDTPGHADFSEDTYRVLSAVDSAIMLIDAAKGLEEQTMKLFAVCAMRGIPLITLINKWDRPGLSALNLLDEIETRTGLLPTPMVWPVGAAGEFRGLLTSGIDQVTTYQHTVGGSTIAQETPIRPEDATQALGQDYATAVEEDALLAATGRTHDTALFLAGQSTPVFFGSAVRNIGVRTLLDALVSYAPPAAARVMTDARARPVNTDFSGYVFKVQSGMDTAHHDRVAYVRVCSGQFQRGMILTHAQTGRPFVTKYAQHVVGRERHTLDTAWPGDVVGLVNASSLRPGDTLYAGEPAEYPPLPRFRPEHFSYAQPADTSKHKQFRRGLEQLNGEGVIQVLISPNVGAHRPLLAAVGPMQFEVVAARMQAEFHTDVTLEPTRFTIARDLAPGIAPLLNGLRGVEVTTRPEGGDVALFEDRRSLAAIERAHPELDLAEPAHQ